jgi:hypothetical protein
MDDLDARRRVAIADLLVFEKETYVKPNSKSAIDARNKWEAKARGQALDMFYDTFGWIPDSITASEIWDHEIGWIYGRFERLGSAVLTGISTDEMQASLQQCENRAQHTYHVLAWSWLRPGTREYVQYVKLHNLEYVRQAQEEFIEGYTVGDKHYCTLCYMNASEAAQRIDRKVEETITI